MRTPADLLEARKLVYLDSMAVGRHGVNDFRLLIEAVRRAYLAHARKRTVLPKTEYLRYPERSDYDRIITLLGYLGGEDFDVADIKQICSSPANEGRGYARASGLIVLNDPQTSRPYAILEGSLISAARTAAVSGLALQELSRPQMNRLALIGCGQLGRTHLAMIADCFGTQRFECLLFDTRAAALDTAIEMASALGLHATAAASQEAAIRAADIVMTATTATQSYVLAEWLRPGSLYCAVSLLDATPELFVNARQIVVDDLNQCLHEGRPLHRLLLQNRLPRDRIVEMGALLAKQCTLDAETGLRVFNPMGTIITDLAVAKTIFDHAVSYEDIEVLNV